MIRVETLSTTLFSFVPFKYVLRVTLRLSELPLGNDSRPLCQDLSSEESRDALEASSHRTDHQQAQAIRGRAFQGCEDRPDVSEARDHRVDVLVQGEGIRRCTNGSGETPQGDREGERSSEEAPRGGGTRKASLRETASG